MWSCTKFRHALRLSGIVAASACLLVLAACGDDDDQRTRQPTQSIRQRAPTIVVARATSTPRPTLRPTLAPTATKAAIVEKLTGSVAAPNGLNMRAGPATDEVVLGKLANGTVLVIVGEQGGCAWLNVVLDDGLMGWVSGEYVQRSFDCEVLAVAADGVRSETLEIAAATPATAESTLEGTEVAQVLSIVDGDTIHVLYNGQDTKLRYIGMDTPEQGQPGAAEATEANRHLVEGQQVTLIKDVSETDGSGRLLRYVYLASGLFVNLELVKQGWAVAVAYPPDTARQQELGEAEKEAVAKSAGRWAQTAKAARAANLRAGPSTTHPLKGQVTSGQSLAIAGRNPQGDWYQLADGAWIAAFLVTNAPGIVPVARSIPTPPPAPPTAAPAATATPRPLQPAAPEPQRAPQPQQQAVCSCSGNNYNCGDFGSHASAQQCYQYCIQMVGFDVHRLDADSDGSACESLP